MTYESYPHLTIREIKRLNRYLTSLSESDRMSFTRHHHFVYSMEYFQYLVSSDKVRTSLGHLYKSNGKLLVFANSHGAENLETKALDYFLLYRVLKGESKKIPA